MQMTAMQLEEKTSPKTGDTNTMQGVEAVQGTVDMEGTNLRCRHSQPLLLWPRGYLWGMQTQHVCPCCSQFVMAVQSMLITGITDP